MTTDPHALPSEPEQPLESSGRSDPPPPPEDAVKFTRAAALWSSLITGFLILIVLLIFIAQNTDSGTFHFLGWNWTLPLGWRCCWPRCAVGCSPCSSALPGSCNCASPRART